MYSIKELAELYKTSRQTIYKKIRSEEMKPYVNESESGIKVDKEGLNILNTIMAESRVVDKQVDNSVNKVDSDVSCKLTNNDTNMLTSVLQAQIEELKSDKQELHREKQQIQLEKQELQIKYDHLINMLINKQQQLEAPKSLLSRLFKAKKYD